eukprot:5620878-Alexandrium_andersonii.AAC.1
MGCGGQAADTAFHWPAAAGTLPRRRHRLAGGRAGCLLRTCCLHRPRLPGRGHCFPLAAVGVGHSCTLEAGCWPCGSR